MMIYYNSINVNILFFKMQDNLYGSKFIGCYASLSLCLIVSSADDFVNILDPGQT